MSDGSATLAAEDDLDPSVEMALLSYARRSAARTGAEWFAAEFQRREEAEQHLRATAVWPASAPEDGSNGTDAGLVDASVENDVVGGAPTGLGFGLPPILGPAVTPEPEPEPAAELEPAVELEPEPAVELKFEPEPAPLKLAPAPAPAVLPRPEPEPEPVPKLELPPPPVRVEPAPAPAPTLRHPHVPRPPEADPDPAPRKRRRRDRDVPVVTAPSHISAPEWARMSPGARKLYGLDRPTDA